MAASTIAAIATPLGEGAIAMLRLSGPDALVIAARTCRLLLPGKRLDSLQPKRLYRAQLLNADGTVLDSVLLSVHRAPASYTGEDLVEISCHGGILLARRALDTLLAAGAASAEPGEFSQRAFLNGKLDLTQAEGVMDLIRAQTDLALRAAHAQLAGKLGQRIHGLREELLSLVAHVEAYIDFPDEEIDPDTGQALNARFAAVRAELNTLLATADQGRILREGVRTVIFGEPNVGKSSLLNALTGFERAIVSATPGTTRDTIEEFINLRGLSLRLIDTAGLRDTVDPIENAGIARTKESVARADVALRVMDASRPPPEDLRRFDDELLVLNKVDLGIHPNWNNHPPVLPISCLTGEGLENLADAIYAHVTSGQRSWNLDEVAINARHRQCLQRANAALATAHEQLTAATSPELVAVDLRAALDAVGEVVGGADAEEILGKIFSTFCIGK